MDMSKESQIVNKLLNLIIVSRGVILKNENCIDDIKNINNYIPEMAQDSVTNKPISADCVYKVMILTFSVVHLLFSS